MSYGLSLKWVQIQQSKTYIANLPLLPRLPLSGCSAILKIGFNAMVQDTCLISSHHIHILTKRKKEKVEEGMVLPY